MCSNESFEDESKFTLTAKLPKNYRFIAFDNNFPWRIDKSRKNTYFFSYPPILMTGFSSNPRFDDKSDRGTPLFSHGFFSTMKHTCIHVPKICQKSTRPKNFT